MIATVKELAAAGIALEVLGLGKLDRSAQSQLTLNMPRPSANSSGRSSRTHKGKACTEEGGRGKAGRPTKTDDALRTEGCGIVCRGHELEKGGG